MVLWLACTSLAGSLALRGLAWAGLGLTGRCVSHGSVCTCTTVNHVHALD